MAITGKITVKDKDILGSLQDFFKRVLETEEIEAILVPQHLSGKNMVMPTLPRFAHAGWVEFHGGARSPAPPLSDGLEDPRAQTQHPDIQALFPSPTEAATSCAKASRAWLESCEWGRVMAGLVGPAK